jgi:AAA domain
MIRHLIMPTGMGYVASIVDADDDDEEVARFEIDDLERHANGGLTGVFVVRSRLDTRRAIEDYVTTDRVTFDAGPSKESFARRLDQLLPPPDGGAHIDWLQLIEAITFDISARASAPTPVSDLALASPMQTIPHLVPFLLPEKRPTILYGPGGTGKSMLAVAAAVAVAAGANFLGWPCEQGEVLYLDWETEEGDIASRVHRVAKGMSLERPPTLHYMNMIHPLSQRMAEVARVIALHEVRLVIIDSVGMASSQQRDGADASEGAVRFFRGLRELGVASLLIDHVTGEDMKRSSTPKPYGSVYKYNAARNAFEIRQREDTLLGMHVAVLTHQKSNLGPKHPDVEVEYEYGIDYVRVRRRGMASGPPPEDRVLDALVGGPITHSRLTDVLNVEGEPISEVTVRLAVRTLVQQGHVIVNNSGFIRLADDRGDGEGA